MKHSGTVLRRNPAVTMRELSEGAGVLLINTRTGAYHRLNRTGAVIWRALVEPTPFEELERRLVREFEGGPAMMTNDLAAYIADLAGRELVHVERERSGSAQ
jgi:hypothetical protein